MILNLKTSIYNELTELGYDVYEFTRVPSDAPFPYVTYNLTNSIESEYDNPDDVQPTLEVDVLDYRTDKDTDVIETMFDNINTSLNRKNVLETDFYYRLERNNLLPMLPTPDEFTFRRQIVFTVDYHERS